MLLDRVMEVVRDRRQRMRMSEASYWNDRVRSRTGHARSVWHAQAFSDAWHERQVGLLSKVLDEQLGDAKGARVLDVGCGTGRMTRELANMGAEAIGVDFSSAAIEAAQEEAQRDGLSCRFEVGDVVHPPLSWEDGSFDAVVAVGCLPVACPDMKSLEVSLREMARLTAPHGAVVLLEPIHSSKLIGRVLKASVDEWISVARSAGLTLTYREGMGFVPARLALSSFDLPSWFVRPAFGAGEVALRRVAPKTLADYTLLSFKRSDVS